MDMVGSQSAGTDDRSIKLIPLTTDPGIEQEPSLSPDGSQVAYSWNGPDQANFDIYVKTTKAGAAVAAAPLRLTRDPADDTNPVWSPDGSSIAFLRKSDVGNQFGLMLMPALGGRERKLAEVSIGKRVIFIRLIWRGHRTVNHSSSPTMHPLDAPPVCFLSPSALEKNIN